MQLELCCRFESTQFFGCFARGDTSTNWQMLLALVPSLFSFRFDLTKQAGEEGGLVGGKGWMEAQRSHCTWRWRVLNLLWRQDENRGPSTWPNMPGVGVKTAFRGVVPAATSISSKSASPSPSGSRSPPPPIPTVSGRGFEGAEEEEPAVGDADAPACARKPGQGQPGTRTSLSSLGAGTARDGLRHESLAALGAELAPRPLTREGRSVSDNFQDTCNQSCGAAAGVGVGVGVGRWLAWASRAKLSVRPRR